MSERVVKRFNGEKEQAQKVKEYTNTFCGHTAYICQCPVCGCHLDGNQVQKYCHECGQKLEWEE